MMEPIKMWLVILLSLHAVCYGSPITEENLPENSTDLCPDDSIFLNEKCVCDLTLCKHPPCNEMLNLESNGTETPGDCCPVYTCDFCTQESILAGNCMCAVGAILTPEGNCECTDEYRILEDGECICDESKCPVSNTCNKESVAIKNRSGCCTHVECKQCPDDSHPYLYNDAQLEDKCVCYPCTKPQKECPVNTTLNVVKRGNSFPGSCCDSYDCVNVTCEVNGIIYGDGETSVSGEDECVCQKGANVCKPKKVFRDCTYVDRIYRHGEKWSEDICTFCSCNDGDAKCIAHICEVKTTEILSPDCPTMTNCNKYCMCGYRINKYGCEYCKCNKLSSCDQLSKTLQETNMTENELIDIIDKYLKIKENEVLKVVETTTDEHFEEHPEKLKSNDYVFAMIIIVFLVIVVVVAAFKFRSKLSTLSILCSTKCWSSNLDEKNWHEKARLK